MFDRQPPSDAELTVIVDCWHDLGTCRALGFGGVGSIPYTAFLEWAKEHGLDWEARQRIWTVIQRLDGERAQRANSKARSGGST